MKTLFTLFALIACMTSFCQNPHWRLTAYSPTGLVCDGIYSEYGNQYHDSVNFEDAKKFHNIQENVWITRYGVRLSVERRSLIVKPDTTYITLSEKQWPGYTFKVEHQYFTGVTAFLFDMRTGEKFPLNLNDSETSITLSTGTADTSYFYIAFEPIGTDKPLAAYPNPVCNNSFALEVPQKGIYAFQIFSDCGILKYQSNQDVLTDGGIVRLKADLKPGLYYVRVTLPDKTYKMISFLKN